METTRQKKVSKLLQKDVAEILQTKVKKEGNYGILLKQFRNFFLSSCLHLIKLEHLGRLIK